MHMVIWSPHHILAHSRGEIDELAVETSQMLSALGSSVHWKTLPQGHTWEQNQNFEENAPSSMYT